MANRAERRRQAREEEPAPPVPTVYKKPPPREVKSDDFVLLVGEEAYRPHFGESVWIVEGSNPMADFLVFEDLKADPSEDRNVRHFGNIVALIKRYLVRWNWTDAAGDPLPQPRDPTDPVRFLSTDEQLYLLGVCQGRTEAEEKNGSSASPMPPSASPEPPASLSDEAPIPMSNGSA